MPRPWPPTRRTQVARLTAELGAPALAGVIDQLGEVDLRHDRAGSLSAGGEAAPVPSSTAPRIQLRCLGAFSLRVDGVEIGWRALRPKARCLLMLLALHQGRPQHRELLIEALWPEATLSSGVRSLQVAVSSIRQCLAAGGVVGDPIRRQGDAYELVLPGAVVDVTAFERTIEEARHLPTGAALAARQIGPRSLPG